MDSEIDLRPGKETRHKPANRPDGFTDIPIKRQETAVIVELVTFKLPEDWDRARELDAVRGVVPKWVANKELVRKHFLWGLGEDAGTGAGFYIWPSIEAAQRAHDDEWREAVRKRTGGDPTSRYFDLMAVVDNEHGAVTEWNADGEARIREAG